MTHAIKRSETVAFPPFSGVRCLMMPYLQGDPTSVPDAYAAYRPIVAALAIKAGDVGFLTIDESRATAGTPHRGARARFGRALHTEVGRDPSRRYFCWGGGSEGGGWGRVHRVTLDGDVRILLANNLDASCAIWNAAHPEPSLDGDIGDAADGGVPARWRDLRDRNPDAAREPAGPPVGRPTVPTDRLGRRSRPRAVFHGESVDGMAGMTSSYRFVAIGDLHLIAGPKNADRLAALDHVIADAQTRGPVDAWFWPGDLTHVGMTIELRNLLVERTIVMAASAPVIVVPGNHDPDGDLDFLERLHTGYGVRVVRKPSVVDVLELSDVNLALFCLPYPSKAQLVAAGTPHDQINAAVDRAMDVIFMQAGAELDAARKGGRLTGAIGHANVGGAVSSVGQPQIGTELEITAQHLARLGDCFKVFNHIHKHQRLFVGTPSEVVYPGSVTPMDWGESERKGYVVVQCEQHNVIEKHWVHSERFVEIPTPRMFHVEGDLSRDGFAWTVKKGPDGPTELPPASWDGCDVRVRARYPQAETTVLAGAKDRVRQLFVGARRFEFEPVAVVSRELRAPEVVQEQTLDGKLRAWARVSGVSWSDEIDRCVDRIQRSDDGDAVVNEVAERLGPLAEMNEQETVA